MAASAPEFITIGQVLDPWGTRGQLKVRVLTDFPQRFAPASEIYINRRPMTISGAEWHKGKAIISLSTIDSFEDARELKGQPIEIAGSQVYPLPEGQYYHFQLIGLEVRTTRQEILGTITEVLTSDSNDNYVVRKAGEEILIPAIEDVVKSVDLDKGCLIIEPLEGLLTLNKKAASQHNS